MPSGEAQFHAEAGSPDSLPQGAAGDLNANLPAGSEVVEGTPELSPDQAQPEPYQDTTSAFPDGTATSGQPEFQPKGLDEELLFGDFGGDQPGTTPVQLPAGRLPSSIVRSLGYMREAAADPNAPESLRIIYRAVVNSMDSELR